MLTHTLSEALASAGYAHRPDNLTPVDRRRLIFKSSTGEFVARLDAHEAWQWLRGQSRDDH